MGNPFPPPPAEPDDLVDFSGTLVLCAFAYIMFVELCKCPVAALLCLAATFGIYMCFGKPFEYPRDKVVPDLAKQVHCEHTTYHRLIRFGRCSCLFPPGLCHLAWFPPDERTDELLQPYQSITHIAWLAAFRNAARFARDSPAGFYASLPATCLYFFIVYWHANAWSLAHSVPGAPCDIVGVNQKLMGALQGTIHFDGVAQSYAASATNQLAVEQDVGDYCLSQQLADQLNSEGVPASAMGSRQHAHPAHATLERHLYRNVFPSLIPEVSVAVIQSKSHKVTWLGPRFHGPYNYTKDARDGSRWPESSLPFHLDADAILVWDVAQCVGPEFVAALHRRYPNVRRIYWGFVYAAETSEHWASLYPDLYQLRYNDANVEYLMEGTSQGSYTQPRNAKWLLDARTVECCYPDGNLTFQWAPLTTFFSHHLAVSDVSPGAPRAGPYSVTCSDMMRIP